jgi:hypothetical protein
MIARAGLVTTRPGSVRCGVEPRTSAWTRQHVVVAAGSVAGQTNGYAHLEAPPTSIASKPVTSRVQVGVPLPMVQPRSEAARWRRRG